MNIEILPEVREKIMYWVEKCPREISGLGKVIHNKGSMLITSAHLLNQENTAASTEIDAADVGRLEYETRDEEGALNFWWHSHVDMDVYWSVTDMSTIHEFGDNGWCLAGVFNKKNEQRFAYYQGGSSFYPPAWSDAIDVKIRMGGHKVESWDKEYDERVKTPVPIVYNKQNGYGAWKKTKNKKKNKNHHRITYSWQELLDLGLSWTSADWDIESQCWKVWDSNTGIWRYCDE